MEPSDFGNVAEERPAIPPTTREAEDESKPMISNCPVATHCENADPEHCDSSVGDSSVLIEEQEDLRQGLPGQAQEGKNPVALKQVNADISAFELSFQALLKTLRCFQEEHLFNSSSNSRNEDELSIQAREGHNLETEEEEQLEAPSAMKNQPIIQTVQTTCKEVREYPSHRTTVSSHGNRRHMVRTNTSISTASRLLSHVCSKEERMLMLAMGRGASMEPDEHEHPLIEDKLPAKSPLVKALNRILHHPGFELSMGMAVCTNAIFIGWEVDYMTARPESTVPPLYFTVISYCYNGTFLMELVLRLMAGCTSFFWKSQLQVLVWNYLDIIIVVSSLVEVGLDILTFNGAENGHVSMSNLRIIRMVRVFRLIRLLRIARFVRFVRALRTLVYSILCTLRSVIWALVLLMTIIYVFAILFTQATVSYRTHESFRGVSDLDRFWGTIGNSMLSLFMAIIGGISWNEVLKPLASVGIIWQYLFLLYIAFIYFAVLNVVTGVFCQAAIEGNSEDHDSMLQTVLRHKQMYTDRFKDLFKFIDADGIGKITFNEFVDRMDEEAVTDYFASLELHCEDALTLFDLFDDAQTEGIQVDEFVMGCLRLKGSARSSDMVRLMHDSRQIISMLQRIIDHFRITGLQLQSSASNLYVDQCRTQKIRKTRF